MHKCVVCRNSSARTKYTRPDVIYHAFPKNIYRKKKWCKVYGIEYCYDWHRLCSDHFLEEDYRPGTKRFLHKYVVPQPYNRSRDENDVPSNFNGITQSNDVEMGNNEFLPAEQNHLSYATQSNDVETSTNEILPSEQNNLSYGIQSVDVETSTNEILPSEQNNLSYGIQSVDVETSTNEFLPGEQNHLSYGIQSVDVETSTNEFLPGEQNHLSYGIQSVDVETSTNEFLPSEQNHLSYGIQSVDVETSTNEFLPSEQNHLSYSTQSNDVDMSTNEFLPREQNRLSYTTQSNKVETSTNEFLPREQNCLRFRKLAYYDESDYIESAFYREVQNAVINKFRSPRRSSRKIKLTTTNENMSYENMPRLQTDRFERQIPTFIANENTQTVSDRVVVPVLSTTKNHTLGNGSRCSVKNCFNRYSKDLSFFGYPCNFTVRKKWIQNCGLQVDPNEKIKSGVKVCRVHFEDDCFLNTKRRNRLKPDAIPTLFLDNVDARNIPSTSSSVNSGFIHVNKPSPVKRRNFRANKRSPVKNGFIRANKPSCSSTNYAANTASGTIPLLVYVDSSFRPAEKFESRCCVPGCITNNLDEIEDISLFAPTEEYINQWSLSLGLDLTLNSIVCERHFRPQDVLHPTLLVNDVGSKLKSLKSCALPPVRELNEVSESRTYCSIPKCITNTVVNVEDFSFFAPENEDRATEWSSSIGLDITINSIVCERHFNPQDILDPNLKMENGLNSKVKSLVPFASPVPLMNGVDNNRSIKCCSVPECITNNRIKEDEDISLFSPKNEESANKWSSILGLQLTVKSELCERHFRPYDMLQPTVLLNGVCRKLKSLVPFSLPMPRNASLSASNATPFIQQSETNDVPVLRPRDVTFKRPDKLSCSKAIKNNVLDKSLATTNKTFSSKNENIVYTAVTNDTHEYNTTSNLDPTLKSNTVKPVDLLIEKIEILDDDDDDLQIIETEPEQILPTSRTKLVEDDDLLPLPSIDDSLSTSLKKLINISANSSLSVTLKPTANYKVTEPSVDLFSKVSAKTSMLRTKHNQNRNCVPSVSLTQSLPSTSSSLMYNISQQSLLQNKQKNDTTAIQLPDNSTNDSEYIVIDDDGTDEFIEKDCGYIYEISKKVVLPSVFWKTVYDNSRNSTVFYQENNLCDTLKIITFDNSLMPKIQICGKKYKYSEPIKSMFALQDLLNKIDNVKICYGFESIINDNCIGHFEKKTEDSSETSCSVCQEKFQELNKMTESKTKTTESLEQKISKRAVKVLELREKMENVKINPTSTEVVTPRPTSLINSMIVIHR